MYAEMYRSLIGLLAVSAFMLVMAGPGSEKSSRRRLTGRRKAEKAEQPAQNPPSDEDEDAGCDLSTPEGQIKCLRRFRGTWKVINGSPLLPQELMMSVGKDGVFSVKNDVGTVDFRGLELNKQKECTAKLQYTEEPMHVKVTYKLLGPRELQSTGEMISESRGYKFMFGNAPVQFEGRSKLSEDGQQLTETSFAPISMTRVFQRVNYGDSDEAKPKQSRLSRLFGRSRRHNSSSRGKN